MIRNIKQKDKESWAKLYKGYANFYKVTINTVILDTLWRWIHNEDHIVNCICYELEGKVVGIAHYRTMPRPIKGQYIGFLDDLFVEPDFRGQKIAQKLINHLKSLSKANDWDGIRWITHSSNKAAKNLYNKIANNTGFELYELKRDKVSD
jgi:ribosomal protein S18 acetylase RimI-like enzyme